MCLIVLAWRPDADLPLVLAANRDEFHRRPALPADAWPDAPQVFGGRDGSAGGSWLAVAPGRLACVTNVRRMVPPNPMAPSRGHLVSRFVRGGTTPLDFAGSLAAEAEVYSGFNLLLLAAGELRFVTNDPAFLQRTVDPGVHAVSNATLDTPWPKAMRLRAAMEHWAESGAGDTESLFAALADPVPARDGELPNTGMPLETERLLSAPFIASEGYGTRASTVVRLHASGAWDFEERRFGPHGVPAGHTRRHLTPGRN